MGERILYVKSHNQGHPEAILGYLLSDNGGFGERRLSVQFLDTLEIGWIFLCDNRGLGRGAEVSSFWTLLK
jgi:hypothetical protein